VLTCKEASKIVSESMERPLSLHERWSLRLHLWMCGNCRRFSRQMHLLRKTMRSWVHRQDEANQKSNLSPDARERIRKAIAESEHTQN